MQVTQAGIETIRLANPLAAVIAERGIELKAKGKTLVGRCPFHRPDKTPSFCVTPGKDLYHCFGCGESGNVLGFVVKHDKVSFPEALQKLARRAGLEIGKLMEPLPRKGNGRGGAEAARHAAMPLEARTPPPRSSDSPLPILIPSEVVDHYHRTFLERKDAQAYVMKERGLTDLDLLRAHQIGYADGSLLRAVPKKGELRDQLLSLGILTAEGRELLGGCIVIPIPDPLTGAWTNLYGRGLRTGRHCYLPGPMRGVLNFQAARLSPEVILAESALDALSFHQAGIATAIPIYGTNGLTPDHLDLLKREGVRRVILALDNDEPGRKATQSIKEKLQAAGIAVRVASFPAGIKDANELLVSRNGDAGEAFRRCLDEAKAEAEAEPRGNPSRPDPPAPAPGPLPAAAVSGPHAPAVSSSATRSDGPLTLSRAGLTYHARVHSTLLGRLKVAVKVFRGEAFHADTLDLYAGRSRAEFARRASKAFGVDPEAVETALLALLVECEKEAAESEKAEAAAPGPPAMTDTERAEALAFLKSPDLLEQARRDVDTLGYVGEDPNVKLLYLVASSRKHPDPLSAVILSQSGAGKSGITEMIEKLMPAEDVVLFTRLTPQSLYYTEPGFLDRKVVIIEERYGSTEADYSIRVLQSRKKLIAAAPIKDPSTGNMRTRTFVVEARASFIEATTASSVNHENATRCFELTMDESVAQTERIQARQRLMRTEAGRKLQVQAEAIVRRHRNAQRLLEPLPVVIPFADKLSFPSSWMRTRRDHARFLNLIEVSAFLHQYQRPRTGDGAIVASLGDYAIAYDLAAQVLAETLHDLKKPLREALGRIQTLCGAGGGSVSRREIREALNQPDSTVRGWLTDLVALEYLEAEASKGGAGKATRYRLTDRGPGKDLLLGLLTPEDLRRLLGRP